jgi:ribonuclease R
MTDPELIEQLLKHVNDPRYRPVKPRVIVKQLDLPDDSLREVRLAIKKLVKQGKLAYGSKHLVRPIEARSVSEGATPTRSVSEAPSVTRSVSEGAPETPEPTREDSPKKKEKKAARRGHLTGVFRRTSKGFGFVRPTGTTREQGREADIYIPEAASRDAADGDLVAVRLSKRRGPKGRVAGEVAEILERNTHRFVGVYDEREGGGYVRVDGKIFAEPIYVGDAGAKNAQPGDKVVVEMVRFPSHIAEGEAVIVEVLGARGEPGVDTLSIIHEFALPTDFPDDVLEDARQQAEQFTESTEGRLDLTKDTIITIDPVDARDFDDAISLEQMPNGHWRLGVHIADVSHFVRPRSALDREAKDRATSVYLPDRVLPMLPEVISNNLASLQPHKVRYTKTCYIEFTGEGIRVHAEVHNAAIKSARRFTYEEVDEYLADRDAWEEKLTPQVHSLVGRMHELAMILRERRLKNGAIELTLPEVKVDLDKEGRVSGAHLVENTVSHQIIEEFMLAANEAVAFLLRQKEIDFLRRVHGQPDPRKLLALTKFVRDLGIECESLESRFEIKRIVELVKDRPEAHAVNYAILRSMQKAVYAPDDEGHWALNSKDYAHFTSPIRRYPDLTVHRIFDALARHKRPAGTFDELQILGEHCSEREQRAMNAERELTKVKLLEYMSKRIGQELDAVITGVEEYGIYCQGIELPAEGFVHVRTLADDYYRYERSSHTLSGSREGNYYRLGDVVRVKVQHVDVDRRELDFVMVKRLKKAPKPPRKKTKGEKVREGKAKRGRSGKKETGGESRGKKGKRR